MLLALVGMSSMTYAQSNINGQETQTLLQTEKLAARLELDETQKAALDKQLKAAKAEREAHREKMKAFMEQMKREAFLARQAQEAQLKEILTDEQWAEYEKLKAQRKEHAGKGKRGMRKRHARAPHEAKGDG